MRFQPQRPFDELGRTPAGQLYDEARRLIDEGSPVDAAYLLHQSAIELPHFKTYELLGECYMLLNRQIEAIPFLAAATTLNRGVRAPWLLAEAWLALGEHVSALEVANIALSRVPNYRKALRAKEVAARLAEAAKDRS